MLQKLKQLAFLASFALVIQACVKDNLAGPEPIKDTSNKTLIHYWSFGTGTLDPDYTFGGGAINVANFTVASDSTSVTQLNVKLGKQNNQYLKVNNPVSSITLNLPTTGFTNPILTFVVSRSTKGALQNYFSYTTNGLDYTNQGLNLKSLVVSTDWTEYQLDFSGLANVNDNSLFGLKIGYNIGNDSLKGNDRYDNISLEGDPIPGYKKPSGPVGNSNTNKTLYLWHFNNLTGFTAGQAFPAPDSAILSNASLTYNPLAPNTATVWDTVGVIRTSPLVASGLAVRLRNPAGEFVLSLPTTGYDTIQLKYAVQRSSKGASQNLVSYSIDGTNFTNSGLTTANLPVDTTFATVTHNFTGLNGVADNPNFKVKIAFGPSSVTTATSGNDRFDNIKLTGRKK